MAAAWRRSLWVLGSALAMIVAEDARAVTIVSMLDHFESGDFSLTDTAPDGVAMSDAQGSLPVVGGSRESTVNLAYRGSGDPGASTTLTVADGLATLSLSGATFAFVGGGAVFQYDGAADGIAGDSSLDIDLTAGGADRFVIEVAALSGSINVDLQIIDTNDDVHFIIDRRLEAVGSHEFVFSDAGVDLTSVRLLRVLLGVQPDESIAVASFATGVPEPSLLALLALVACGVALDRQRSGLQSISFSATRNSYTLPATNACPSGVQCAPNEGKR